MSLLKERMHDPPHQGPLEDATGVGAVGNPACGDVLRLYVRCEPPEAEGTVRDARFESLGSPYQLATASVLCDCIIGATVAEARSRTEECVLEKLPGLPAPKRHLARLAIEALGRALEDQDRRVRGEDAPLYQDMGPAEARALVQGLLMDGARWSTDAIIERAHGDGFRFVGPVARLLLELRKQGVIEGEMDDATRSWRWWDRAAAAERA